MPGAAGRFSEGSPVSRSYTHNSRTSTLGRRLDVRVGNRFRVQEKLGAGAFGDCYRGVDVVTGNTVAIKLEPSTAKSTLLLAEARLYKSLGRDGPRGIPDLPVVGIPRLYWYGEEGDFNVMVVQMLGPSLEDIFQFCGKRLSPAAVACLGYQMMSRIEFMHSRHMLHRDIKPDNFLTGWGSEAHTVHIIDFGLSRLYRDPKNLRHIPFCLGRPFVGTQRYCSVRTHLGYQQGRRDDVEAVGFVCVYLVRGVMPWQGMQDRNGPAAPSPRTPAPSRSPARTRSKAMDDPAAERKAAYVVTGTATRRKVKGKAQAVDQVQVEKKRREKLVGCKKLVTPLSVLRKGGVPRQFTDVINYARHLDFAAKPDYGLLRSWYAEAARAAGVDDIDTFDWLHEVRARDTAGLFSPGARSRGTGLPSRPPSGSTAPVEESSPCQPHVVPGMADSPAASPAPPLQPAPVPPPAGTHQAFDTDAAHNSRTAAHSFSTPTDEHPVPPPLDVLSFQTQNSSAAPAQISGGPPISPGMQRHAAPAPG
eukprot:TRINITY_DN55392_c0_g1_i1.p1 TRINITY_DN55392_c0_g1~~TRINITY_DN55392_c0_g1_i1.p1  ORF type:complete len:532 (+),score=99.52 TRINITY_DN55392_c0_g1_i1:190-1785(+)